MLRGREENREERDERRKDLKHTQTNVKERKDGQHLDKRERESLRPYELSSTRNRVCLRTAVKRGERDL